MFTIRDGWLISSMSRLDIITSYINHKKSLKKKKYPSLTLKCELFTIISFFFMLIVISKLTSRGTQIKISSGDAKFKHIQASVGFTITSGPFFCLLLKRFCFTQSNTFYSNKRTYIQLILKVCITVITIMYYWFTQKQNKKVWLWNVMHHISVIKEQDAQQTTRAHKRKD